MSNNVNTQLLERVAEMIDHWEGTLVAQLLEHDIEVNDLDQLAVHVSQAEGLASQQEFNSYDVY